MRILVIPDLHGKTCWKEAVAKKDFDKVVFLGDYTDSWDVTDDIIVNNVLDIIAYKKANPDNVICLLGNHDIQYKFFPDFRCSGFRASYATTLYNIFKVEKDVFLNAYGYKNYIFTHAGISKKWYKQYESDILEFGAKYGFTDLVETINAMGESSQAFKLYEVGMMRGGLRGNQGGICWADKNETLEGIIPDYHQIVGHTPQAQITTYNKFMGTVYEDRSITYCDTLDKDKKTFLILDI